MDVQPENVNVLFQVVGLKFYREGIFMLFILAEYPNMLLSFAVFVLSTKPSEFVDELEKRGFSCGVMLSYYLLLALARRGRYEVCTGCC